MRALAAALHENKGLVHLTVHFGEFDDSDITELLEAIILHPSLRSLELCCPRSDGKEKRHFIKAVADMLSVNDRVEAARCRSNTFDKGDWDAYVVPKLKCNFCRKWFPSIQTIGEASTRAAVLASAIAKFASKPHLVLMLLNQNHDVVSSYLDSANDLNLIPSRKDGRSPASDAMIFHLKSWRMAAALSFLMTVQLYL
jgi:hypothetical protein